MSDDLADLLRWKKQLDVEREEKTNEIKELCSSDIESFFDCLEYWLSDLLEEQIISTFYEPVILYKHKSGAYKI